MPQFYDCDLELYRLPISDVTRCGTFHLIPQSAMSMREGTEGHRGTVSGYLKKK